MRLSVVVLIALAVGLAGCSAPPPPAVQLHPVEGTVIVAGRKAGHATVAFHPLDAYSRQLPVGVTGLDGTFRLTTRTAGDGAPAGEYAVTVLWIDESIPFDCCEGIDLNQHDRLHGEYADATTTTLRATVVPGGNTVTLHADPGTRGWNLPRRPVEPRP